MRRWELQQGEDELSEKRAAHADREVGYITISRQVGSGGDEVARLLTEMMRWELYDKDILNFMSENMNVQKEVLEKVNERSTGWIEDVMAPLFTDRPVTQIDYYRHLVRVLFLIAQEGKAIIVGRCAGLVLPRERGLSVRITAPLELRVKRYAAEQHLKAEEARAAVLKAEEEREEFVKNFLNKRVGDAKYYDLICNTEKLSAMSVAKLIWRAVDLRRTEGEEEEEGKREEG